MTQSKLPVLIDPTQLAGILDHDNLKLVYVGSEEKFADGHIPDSVRISQNDLNHGVAPQAGHLPGTAALESLFSGIGLSNDDHVIAYDDEAGTAAARLFWVLEAMGHKQVSFLDGGLLAWRAATLPLTTKPAEITASSWQAQPDSSVLADKKYVLASLDNPDIQILDARSAEEHAGIKSASDRKGHIPGAIHMNWLDTRDVDSENRLIAPEKLRKTLEERGFNPDKEIIAHCQTHQRSSHSFMMLRSLGFENVRGFDGSWSEWAADHELPVVNQQLNNSKESA